jgi:two-component system OmpR family sensor kinase
MTLVAGPSRRPRWARRLAALLRGRAALPRALLSVTLLPRTLRGRLIAGLVALLAIGCATVGVTTYYRARDSLLEGISGQLETATGLWNRCVYPSQAPVASGGTAGHGLARVTYMSRAVDGGEAPPPSTSCTGLAPGTLEATISVAGVVTPNVEGLSGARLSPADQRTLRLLPVTHHPQDMNALPVYYRGLGSLNGGYILTAMTDSDGDATCITGLPLATVEDTLHDMAATELVVFGLVLVLATVLGTVWVELSTRPLRRVAATASEVAELPLEWGEVAFHAGVPDTDPRTETGRLGAAFNRMLGHVQAALARRNASEIRLRRFAADASHELRTPLAAIRGYAEFALRQPGGSPEPVIHALNRVLSESTRMTVLVDDLLLLARLDAGRPLERGPVDLSRLAIEATSDARVASPGQRWLLDLPDDPLLVAGDEHRLQQVLVNLLSNAGRHTPAGTTVTVKLSVAEAALRDVPAADDGISPATVSRGAVPPVPRLVLTVTDNGPGVAPDLLPDLFERFTRADSARSHATDPASTGLGLAIVDAVVGAHDGAVQVASRPGLTRFTVFLPRLVQPADAPPDRARPPRKARA